MSFCGECFPRGLRSRPAAAFVAFPGVGIFVGRFTNDALALPLAAALLALLVPASRGRLSPGGAATMAAVLTASLWTKLYFLLLLPAVVIASLGIGRGRTQTLRRTFLAVSFAVLALLPWLAHQKYQTGDWLGLLPSKQATALGIGLPARLSSLADLWTPRFAIVFGRTFLWPGTRSASGAPASVAVTLSLMLLMLAIGAGRAGPGSARTRRTWWAGGFAVAVFLLGQLVYASTYAAIGEREDTLRSPGPTAGISSFCFLSCCRRVAPLAACRDRACSFWRRRSSSPPKGLMTFGALPGVYGGRTAFNGSNVPLTTLFSADASTR
jgi:hypothetical protein